MSLPPARRRSRSRPRKRELRACFTTQSRLSPCTALDALAEHAGLQLVYSAALVKTIDSPGLTGDYTAEGALTRLLADTGLAHRYTGPATVTLHRPNPLEALVAEAGKPMEYAGATQPTPKEPQEPPKKNGPTVLPEMTVSASPVDETSYNPPNATTATKTDTPIMETPVSIQVVPQQVLKDQQAIRLSDGLKNVSGVVRDFGFGSCGDYFLIRGFENSTKSFGLTQIYRDGALAVGAVF